MPEKIKRHLKESAKKKFPGNKEHQDKYVYGALHKLENPKKGKRKMQKPKGRQRG